MTTTPEALALADILRKLAVAETERDKERASRQDAQRQLYEERARLYEMVRTEQVKTSQALSERDQLRTEAELLRDALWKASGDDREVVNGYLEAVGLPRSA